MTEATNPKPAKRKRNPPKAVRAIWKLLVSLKFAIIVMVLLTLGMIIATVLESMYDTPTAQYFVYRHLWFYGVLVLFGVNILCVALSRLPWQKRHIPFLLAHLGILVLLYGSWLTFQFGVDGNLSVSEGTEEAVVELNEPQLLVADAKSVQSFSIPWRPSFVPFSPIEIPEYGLRISKWITHAESDLRFIPDDAPAVEEYPDSSAHGSMGPTPAIHLKIFGGPKAPPFMRRGQDLWLWTGDMSWAVRQLGPAVIQLVTSERAPFPDQRPALQLRFDREKKTLFWVARGSDGSEKRGAITDYAKWSEESPTTIDPGWKNDVRVNFFSFLPQAKVKVEYRPSVIESGQGAPDSAIFVEPLKREGSIAAAFSPASPNSAEGGIWLGMGERARFSHGAEQLQIGYFPKRLVLPFSIRLNRFQIDHYAGTMNPMSFASLVTVPSAKTETGDALTTWIRMNEPLKHGGYTFYQASYVPGEPRPTTSVFSVNQDPGRWVKYLGSLILVLGSILFFIQKLRAQKARAGVKT